MSLDEKSQKLGEMLAQIRNSFQGTAEAIDTFINYLGRPSDNTDQPELYEKLNWESRAGNKGEFQMLRKDNCNNTELFNHLESILRQNKNNATISGNHYWTGEKPGYIFRRRKKDAQQAQKLPLIPKRQS